MTRARVWVLLAVAWLGSSASFYSAPVSTDEGRLYVLPLWDDLTVVPLATARQELQQLRARIGEGGPVRAGFTVYITIDMTAWPVASESEAAAALVGTVQQIDDVIARAQALGAPIALNFVTAIRDATDPAQISSQAQDRRVMQWFDDNAMADGWWTLSRYARQQYAVRERYLRALGRVLANRMARYPDAIVAASGDGEVELAFPGTGTFFEFPEGPLPYADYSPFAIAEFRDWLRGEGLYAPGQRFAADAYSGAARYRGDPSPAADATGSGATLNGDFGVSFTTWSLRYFDWTLGDAIGPSDLRAIPKNQYDAPGFDPLPDAGTGFFDAPRTKGSPDSAWWRVWFEFRQALVRRYNVDFATWITTSADPQTGLTVPASRWYAYQIPADYLFGHTPQAPDLRFLTSASSWTSADIRPFGGAGYTAFNTTTDGVNFARTLASLAPLAETLGTRWAILEWAPSVPAVFDPAIYRAEMTLVERYRPTVLAPLAWNHPQYPILGTGFETALKEMVDRLAAAPWNLRADVTGAAVRLTWAPPERGPAVTQYRIEVDAGPDGGPRILTLDLASRSTALNAIGGPGVYYVRVRAVQGTTVSAPSNMVRVQIGGTAAPPDAPSHVTAVVTGSTLTFNWLAPLSGPRPTGYAIEAGSGPGLANLARLTLPASTTFAVANVAAGTYHVRVRGVNGSLAGAASNEVVVSPLPGLGHCTPVDPPGTVQFTLTGRRVDFTWDEPARGAAPTGYVLEAGSAPGLANLAVLPLGLSRAFSVVAPPGTFYIRLRASNACGTSVPGPDVRLDVS
jgi:hypothetical protein